MKRYISLFSCLFNQSLKSFLIYRATALITIFFGILFYAAECVLGIVLFSVTDVLRGYTFHDYLLMITVASLITYLYQFFFVEAQEMLAETILEGELDSIILRPVNSLFYYSFQRQDFSCLGNILVTLPVLVWLYYQYEGITIFKIFLFLLFVMTAVITVYVVNQFFVTFVFWFENSTKVLGVSEYIYDAATRPIGIYPKAVIFFLSYVLPFGIVTNSAWSIPIHGLSYTSLFYLLVWNVLGLILVNFVWKKGLAHYASAN